MLQSIEREHYSSEIVLPALPERFDLGIVQLGRFVSRGGFCYAQRSPWGSIHLIRRGRGVFRWNNTQWCATAGSVMVLFPGESYSYWDSEEAPWEYDWISLAGDAAQRALRSCGFSPESPWRSAAPREALELAGRWRLELSRENLWPYTAVGAAWEVLRCFKPESGPTPKMSDAMRLQRVLEQSGDLPISVEELAEILGMNRSTVYRMFMREYKMPIKVYLNQRRLARALELLRNPAWTVAEVARLAQFSTPQYFARCFRERYGVTPSLWRENFLAGILSTQEKEGSDES